MSATYYARSAKPAATMTVRQLINHLAAMPDQDAPVIFKSPTYGCFGSDTEYSIDRVCAMEVAEERTSYGPQRHFDEETGEEWIDEEDYEEIKHAWKGVVIE